MSGYITGLERCLYVLCEGSGPQEKARRMLQKLKRNHVYFRRGSYLEKGGCLGGEIVGVMEVFPPHRAWNFKYWKSSTLGGDEGRASRSDHQFGYEARNLWETQMCLPSAQNPS